MGSRLDAERGHSSAPIHNEAGSVWRDCRDQGAETITPTSLPGLVASLTKKGLATTNGESVGLTPLGFAA